VSDLGSIVNGDTVRLERDFPFTADKLWAYLTAPDGLRAWIAEGDIGPERAELRFLDDGSEIAGGVTAWDPPHVVEFEWNGGPTQATGSRVRFELIAAAAGTRLVLTHSRANRAAVLDFAAGWHVHLDTLGFLAERVVPAVNRSTWTDLRERYLNLDAAVRSS
jgi:uncharacterized protein YndB with AHSA1/START domain